MQEEAIVDGTVWITDSALVAGDYCGTSSVGEANLRDILQIAEEEELEVLSLSYSTFHRMERGYSWEDDPSLEGVDILELYGAYGSRSVYVRKSCEILREVVDALENYPLISDDTHGKVEMEWEDEAWESWVRSDLIATLDDDTQEKIEGVEDSALFQAYRHSMEDCNEYPVAECSGVYVAVDRIASTFAEYVAEILASSPHSAGQLPLFTQTPRSS